MPQGGRPSEAGADIAARRDALRQAARLPGVDPRSLIDAALTELDAAIEAIGAASSPTPGSPGEPPAEVLPESVRTERRLLHAVFQQAPVPLFLLEQDGTIRRANNKAAALLGAPSGYATGRPLERLHRPAIQGGRRDAARRRRQDRQAAHRGLPDTDL